MYLVEYTIERYTKLLKVGLISVSDSIRCDCWSNVDDVLEKCRGRFLNYCLISFDSFVEDVTTYYKNPNLRGCRVFSFKDVQFGVNVTIHWIGGD